MVVDEHGQTPMVMSRHVGQGEHLMRMLLWVEYESKSKFKNKIRYPWYRMVWWAMNPPHMIFQEPCRCQLVQLPSFFFVPRSHKSPRFLPSLSCLQFSHYHVHVFQLFMLVCLCLCLCRIFSRWTICTVRGAHNRPELAVLCLLFFGPPHGWHMDMG